MGNQAFWYATNKEDYTAYEHPEEKLPPLEEMMATFKVKNILVTLLGSMPKEYIQKLHFHIIKAITLIERNPVTRLALSGSHIIIGETNQIKRKYGVEPDDTLAKFGLSLNGKGYIFLFIDQKNTNYPLWQILVHEYGHHFDHMVLRSKGATKEFEFLLESIIAGHNKTKLPQIGDPLSDLREDWWTVKMASTFDFYLTKIVPNTAYIYTNIETGETIELSSENVEDRVFRPSRYSKKNFSEFMAEMFVLVVAGKNMGNSLLSQDIKANQKWLVVEYLKIAKKYL